MRLSTFRSYKDQFVRYIKLVRNLSHHTVRAYSNDLSQFIDFWSELDKDSENKTNFREAIDIHFMNLYKKSVDKSSIARKISCFRSLSKFLKLECDSAVNFKLSRPRLDKKLPVYLSDSEFAHILDSVSLESLESRFPIRDKAIIELFYATGVRCSELVEIRMNNLNFTEKSILIRGKGRRERIVLFGNRCLERLQDYIRVERPAVKRISEHLFLNYRYQGLTTRSVQRICEKFRPFLNNRSLTPHAIRHSFAALLINRGANLCTIQKLLGHASLTSTERYTHLSMDRLRSLCTEQHPILAIRKFEDL